MTKKKSIGKRLVRYLIEIIIIIVGITLSFALNEWNNKQDDADSYQNHLENLSNDLAIDEEQMKSDQASITAIQKSIKTVLKYDHANRDSLPKLSRAVDGLMLYIEFLPNNNTFQMLSSTGGFRVFKNKELVKEMIQLYKYDYAYIGMMGRHKDKVFQDRLVPLLYEEIYFEDAITYPVIRTDVKAFLTNKKFRNICIDYDGSLNSYGWAYTKALKRLEQVKKMIADEVR